MPKLKGAWKKNLEMSYTTLIEHVKRLTIPSSSSPETTLKSYTADIIKGGYKETAVIEKRVKVLDRGYVEVFEAVYDPDKISKIAGLSHDHGNPGVDKLIQWGHESPLEFAHYTFLIKAPITVFRQLMRHRTGKYLERSLRYCATFPEVYLPDCTPDQLKHYHFSARESLEHYNSLINLGAPKEQARGVLPLHLYSLAYVKFDCRNLRHMLKLRLDKSAQYEIRQYAEAIASFIHPSLQEGLWPTKER